jgi:hypothetical protein
MNLTAIPTEETPAPAQATKEIPIAKDDSKIDSKTDNVMKAFQPWSFQVCKPNEHGYLG